MSESNVRPPSRAHTYVFRTFLSTFKPEVKAKHDKIMAMTTTGKTDEKNALVNALVPRNDAWKGEPKEDAEPKEG